MVIDDDVHKKTFVGNECEIQQDWLLLPFAIFLNPPSSYPYPYPYPYPYSKMNEKVFYKVLFLLYYYFFSRFLFVALFFSL